MSEQEEQPRPKRMTEDERREIMRKRLGVASVDAEKLWRERSGASSTAGWHGKKPPNRSS